MRGPGMPQQSAQRSFSPPFKIWSTFFLLL
jgi:hypothetical protein